MTQDLLFAKVEQWDHEAVLAEGPCDSAAIALWTCAAEALVQWLELNPEDLPARYRLAYLDYMVWARSGEEHLWRRAVDNAETCAAEGNDLTARGRELARFYLTCLHFDKDQFESALSVPFTLQDIETCRVAGQDWRWAKILEMRLGALLHLDDVRAMETAEELLLATRSAEEPAMLFPLTAGRCLDEWLRRSGQMTGPGMAEAMVTSFFHTCEVSESTGEICRRFPGLAAEWRRLGLGG